MDLQQYRKISPAMNEEIKAVFEKHGFSTRKLNASIDEKLGIVRLSIEIGDNGAQHSPEAAYFLHYVKTLGEHTNLKAEWLDQTFEMGGQVYRLTGMRKGSSKKPMQITRCKDGGTYVTTQDAVADAFAKQRAA